MRSRLLLLILVVACAREPQAPAPAPAQPAAPPRVNLLTLQHGASVISRTAEYWYEATAAHAIDGDEYSAWLSPNGGPEQTMVFAFATRSRIRSLGVMRHGSTPHRLRVESSLDGAQWTPVTTLELERQNEKPQIRDVAPFEALYLRVHTIAPNETFAEVRELYAHGEEVAPLKTAPIEGCWSINGRPARFTTSGAEVQGVIDAQHGLKEIHLDGGFDGRAYRFMWRAGAQVGDALVTVSPDGKAISGVRRHKAATGELPGDGWIGKPGPCTTTAIDAESVRARVLQTIGRYPVYALRFDEHDRLLVEESRNALQFITGLKNVRLVARGRAARLTSLHDALAAGGADVRQYQFIDGKPATPGFWGPAIEVMPR